MEIIAFLLVALLISSPVLVAIAVFIFFVLEGLSNPLTSVQSSYDPVTNLCICGHPFCHTCGTGPAPAPIADLRQKRLETLE